MARILLMSLVSLAIHQSAIIVDLQGGRNFLQRMSKKGIRVGAVVIRVGIEELKNQSLTTKGRDRGQNKGRGFGINQVFVKVNGNVINLGQGEAMHIFVKLDMKKMMK